MTTQFKIALTALALILAPLASSAHHREGHSGGKGHSSSQEDRGNGNGNRGSDSEEVDDDEAVEEEAVEEATGGRPCAWGLAKRDVACVPPGQAARGVTTDEWIGAPTSVFEAGQDLSSDGSFGLVANADRLGLAPLPDGQVYAVAGDSIIVADVTETTAEDGTVTTTYTYNSTVRRAAFPGRSNG